MRDFHYKCGHPRPWQNIVSPSCELDSPQEASGSDYAGRSPAWLGGGLALPLRIHQCVQRSET
jgi:hypothetical protein